MSEAPVSQWQAVAGYWLFSARYPAFRRLRSGVASRAAPERYVPNIWKRSVSTVKFCKA